MPDWLTHTLIGWISGKITKLDISLVVIGALIPDLVKINIVFVWLRIDHLFLFEPIHTPIGAILIGGVISLFFKDCKKAFIALCFGITTHFILDFFLVHVTGGMKLFYPISWKEWQIYIIRSDEYLITVITIFLTILVFLYYYLKDRQKNIKKLI